MSSLLLDFVRATCRLPCPVCEKPDWCLVSRDDPQSPSKVICSRVESVLPWGEAGWLHRLRDDGWRPDRNRFHRVTLADSAQGTAHVRDTAARAEAAIDAAKREALALMLDVSSTSLQRLNVGWLAPNSEDLAPAWTFPMRDALECLIGLRIRRADGTKLAVLGSRSGLFMPRDLVRAPERLFLAEGESDTAALLDLGFDAVGRPGCKSGAKLAAQCVRRLAPLAVVVVSDADEVGRLGADRLARQLVTLVRDVRVIEPPPGIKDMREWKCHGATREDVLALVERAAARHITFTISGKEA